jgi:hypothetical protein
MSSAGVRHYSLTRGEVTDSFVGVFGAAERSPGSGGTEELATWIQSLPEKEKNNLLVAAVSGTGERWKHGLLRRFEQQTARRTLSAPDTICRRLQAIF